MFLESSDEKIVFQDGNVSFNIITLLILKIFICIYSFLFATSYIFLQFTLHLKTYRA